MKKNNFFSKLNIIFKLSFILIIISLFNLKVSSVWAFSTVDIASGGASKMMEEIFKKLGVNEAEVKYSIQSYDSFRRKKTPPTVSLIFTPLNPSNGEKITATATPTYFLNDSKDLYYTWFLKSKNCPHDINPSQDEKVRCDLNHDGKVDIEDYKIKATRIIVNNGFEWSLANYSINNDSDGYKASYGGNDQAGKKSYCYVHDTVSGDEYQIGCAHLFPDININGKKAGDGTFGVEEEKFWHTDPNSNDTAGTGNLDEANVVGLGINKFTWNYETGDEVGVVVEGVSVEPAQTNDSSFRTMWAMPVKMCDISSTIKDYPKKSTQTISVVKDSPNIGETTTTTQTTIQNIDSRAATIATIKTVIDTTITVTDSNTGSVISSSTTSGTPTYTTADISDSISVNDITDASDLNNCLYDNLINPAESGAQGHKLEVNLSYSPKIPMNDTSGADNGDELVITSSIPNTNDKTYLQYYWQVYESDEANPDSWGNPLTKSQLIDSSQSNGIGLDTFKFKLNFANPKKYLRVKLTVVENNGSSARKGHSDVVIPINSSSDNIHVYSVETNSGNINITNNERCFKGIDKIVCPVMKDEIIGLKVDNNSLTDFSWKIDNKTSSCFSNPMNCQNDKQTNITYFPVLKNKGEYYIISLDALNQNTGEKIHLTKTFVVVDPSLKIVSNDETVCRSIVLGKYIGLDGTKYLDKSKTNFQAVAGKEIKLKPEATGISSSTDYMWTINGKTVSTNTASDYGFTIDSNNGNLILPAKNKGESYDISVSALYSQDNLIKQALNEYWGVSYNQFYEKPISATIHIDIIGNLAVTKAKVNKQKIMANIYASVPNYLSFLLKLVLTAGILLFGAKFILSLTLDVKK